MSGLNSTAGVGLGPHAPEEPGVGAPGGLNSTAGVGLGPHAPEEPGVGAPGGLNSTAGVGLGPHAPEEGGLGCPPGPDSTADVLAIHQLKYAYFRFLDLKQFHELGELLTEDATAAYVDATENLEGRAAVVAFLEDALSDPAIVTLHQGHHPEITVADDGTATGIWYLSDRVILTEHDLEIGGTAFYQDAYVRTADGWRISHTGYRRVFEEHRHHISGERIFFKSRFQPD